MRFSRVLITGGSGLLALNWACCMRASHEVILARHSRKITLDGVSVASLDLESDATLTKQLEVIRPGLVVHTAGLASVDLCEQQPAAAMHANAELARKPRKIGVYGDCPTSAIGVSRVRRSPPHNHVSRTWRKVG